MSVMRRTSKASGAFRRLLGVAFIEAHDVLAVGDDAQLVQARNSGILDQARVVDSGLAQRLAQVLTRGVLSDEGDEADLGAECGEIRRGIRRSPRTARRACLAHDGNRRLLAEPDRVALEPGVEHRVADNENAQPGKPAHNVDG